MIFEEHLKAAVSKEGRPWEVVPDYKSKVDCIFSPSEAARLIRSMITLGGLVAFDYETTAVYPEHEGAAIVACSVCWNGKVTIAFPWLGEAVDAMRELLRSPLGKIASNMKFEERWTRHTFGRGARNWVWDTMLAAHLIDNRPEITGLKFQAFVLLGAQSYDDHIKPYLKAKKGQRVNRIKDDVETRQLLEYNGLDSLLEYKVAMIQSRLIGINLKEQA
jgi:hypothetical protein